MLHRAALIALALAAASATPSAHALELLTNGGFEADTGTIQSPDTITGWNTSEYGILGGVLSLADTVSPVSGAETVGAAAGSRYALLDLAAPSQMALSQHFTTGAQPYANLRLSYDYFFNYAGSESGFTYHASGLDFETGGSDETNLHFRVDILRAGGDAFSSADAVLSTTFGATLSAGPNAYSNFSFDWASPLLDAHSSYVLRFAAVSNAGQLQVGIDNVSLDVTPVPEPEGWALMLAGLALVGAAARRRT